MIYLLSLPALIRALLAECECILPTMNQKRKRFNPRTPHGVRKFGTYVLAEKYPCLNPRTPRGVRIAGQNRIIQVVATLIRALLAECE